MYTYGLYTCRAPVSTEAWAHSTFPFLEEGACDSRERENPTPTL